MSICYIMTYNLRDFLTCLAKFLGLLGHREAETWKFDLREAVGLEKVNLPRFQPRDGPINPEIEARLF